MIHHLSVGANDLQRARTFYGPVLGVLGLVLVSEDKSSLDYGVGDFMFSVETPVDGRPAAPGNGTHIAFRARDRKMVDAFHRIALENGGSDAGPPGLRPEYEAHYYGAFVYDPDGNKLEAVTFAAT